MDNGNDFFVFSKFYSDEEQDKMEKYCSAALDKLQTLYPGKGTNSRLLTPSVRAYLETDDYMQMGYFSDNAEAPELCCILRFLNGSYRKLGWK